MNCNKQKTNLDLNIILQKDNGGGVKLHNNKLKMTAVISTQNFLFTYTGFHSYKTPNFQIKKLEIMEWTSIYLSLTFYNRRGKILGYFK